MAQWLLILGAALLGGMLVLHAFGKIKSANDCMLGMYANLLDSAQAGPDDDADRRDAGNPQPAPDADETAPPA